tara:strand:- start:152 stop:1201 length:1050 start_codon:yes stop_codon:yes gene_type:complete
MKYDDVTMDPSELKTLQQDGDVLQESGELIFNPYNPNNKEITLNQVQSILQRYGITSKPHNLELYKRAFVHRSYTKRPSLENEQAGITIMPRPKDCLALKTKSNERLEFVGDGVLELITKYYLYKRFPKADEGFMTEKKIALVKNEHIGKLAQEMHLHPWLLLSRHAEEKRTRNNLKKLGCLFEAFVGAIFLDFNRIQVTDKEGWFENVFTTGPGFQMAQVFVEHIFEMHVDWVQLIKNDDNFKNILQVKIQKAFKTTPDYLELDHDVETGYRVGLYLRLGRKLHTFKPADAEPFEKYESFKNIHQEFEKKKYVFICLATAVHKIKKKAEQLACQNALKLIPADQPIHT